MALVDEFETTIRLSSTFDALPEDETRLLSYNTLFRQNGYPVTPAKWRRNVCHLISTLLEHKVVPIDFVMCELQKYLNSERYGFNGDITIFLAKYNVPINSVIIFRGIKCTLLHGIVAVCGGFNLSADNETFHNYLIKNKPIIDVKDEYGRTALAIAVWNLSVPTPNINEVNVIRCLIEYGFSPFVKHRGLTVIDKLAKICEMIKQSSKYTNDKDGEANESSKAIQVLFETYDKIKFFRDRVNAIQSSLKVLVHNNVIVCDIANVIQDCIGISNYTKRKIQSLKIRRNHTSLKDRIRMLSRQSVTDREN
eukprot:323228_1